MPELDSLSIRPYRAGDDGELVELFGRTFGRPISPEHWRWKLRSMPCAAENVWLALSGTRAIFQYAGIPAGFWVSQTRVEAMVSVDTMTDPEFRRRGLLTRVAAEAYAAWRTAGVAFVIGLPNEQWGSRTAALGWKPIFPLQWLVRPLRPEATLARWLGVPALKRLRGPMALYDGWLKLGMRRDAQIQTAVASEAGDDFDRIWAACRSDWSFAAVHDRAWVDWRFFAPPSGAYTVTVARRAGAPVGYSAYRLAKAGGTSHGYLADILTAHGDEAARRNLLCEVIEALRATEAQALFALAIPGTPVYRCLRRAGFLARHSFLVQVVPLRPDGPWDAIRHIDRCNLTGADFDVV